MADHIQQALDERYISQSDARQKADAKTISVFLRSIIAKGPDEEMMGKPHLFSGFYWTIIKAFLIHLADRLEARTQDLQHDR